jgi:hypothetical protein
MKLERSLHLHRQKHTPFPLPTPSVAKREGKSEAKLSEAEIIQELHDKGKYDEWVKFGRLYGLTSDVSRAKFFLVRPFLYQDMNHIPVAVSMVQSTFRADVDNIAVFQQVHKKEIDPYFVAQGKHKFLSVLPDKNCTSGLVTSGLVTSGLVTSGFVTSGLVTYGFATSGLVPGYLHTSGLATCSSLALVIGARKFMTHLDAHTRTEPILADLWQGIQEEQVLPETLRPFICTGSLNSRLTEEKATHICVSLGIPSKNVQIQSVCMFDSVVI